MEIRSSWYVYKVFLLVSFTGQKDCTTMATNLCSRYDSCIDCIQDPCSRNDITPENEECVFCTSNSSCIRRDQAVSVCLRDNTKINFCAVSASLSTTTDYQCGISSPYFNINLDYSETIEGSDPSDTVHSGVAICHNAVLSLTGNHCLPQSPIVIYEAPVVGDSHCWNIGNVLHTNMSFINDSNPSQGIEISYGTTHCCPHNGLDSPGNVGSLRVVVTLLPGNCNKLENVWSLAEIDYPKPSITNCSAAPSETFRAKVITTRLCPQQIFWKLSLNNSELDCSISVDDVSCRVIPRLAINNSIDTSLCSRFNVDLRYQDSAVQVKALSNLTKGTNNPCTFVVRKGKNLRSISVKDVDGKPVGKVYTISHKTSRDSGNNAIIIGVSVTGLLAVIAGVIFFIKRRQKRSTDEEKGRLLDKPSGSAHAHNRKDDTLQTSDS